MNSNASKSMLYNNEKIIELLSRANELETQKDYKNALDIYNEALKIASEESLVTDASHIYKKIGLIYYKQKNYKASKKNFNLSILKDKASKNAADSYFNLALVYRKENNQDSLLLALKKSLSIYESLEDSSDKFSTFSKAGILYKHAGDYDDAIKYLLKAYEGFSDTKAASQKAAVCGTIADIQRHLKNFDISEEYYRQSLLLRRQGTDTLKLSFAYNNLANLFYETKVYDSALVYYEHALKLQRQLKNTKNIGKTLSNLGMTHSKLEALNKAEDYYQDALRYKKQVKDSNAIVQTLNELTLISLKNKQQQQTKTYLNNNEAYINTTTENPFALRHLELQADYYRQIGDYKKASDYQQKHFNLYKKTFNELQSKTIQTLQEQFESELKAHEISELNQKNKQKELTITAQNEMLKNKNLLLLLFGLIILFLVGVYLFLKQRQKAKLQKLEYKKLEAVLKGQEHLKEHISKDLHDIITTSYDGIRLKILALSKAKDPKSIEKMIIEDIKNVNHEIRLISHRLSPLGNKIKEASLTEIIISQLSEFQHYRHIFIDVQLPLPEILNLITLEAQTNFYGILLEALNNIEKHSKATEVKIQHTKDSHDKLTFKVSDNGIGIESTSLNGIGLSNIKQRTTLLGGGYNITSTEKGTCLTIVFPINPNLK